MVDPGHEDAAPEQLSGGDAAGRHRAVAVVTVVALVAGGIWLARAGHHPSAPQPHERADTGRTVSNQAAHTVPTRRPHPLFLAPVDACLKAGPRRLEVSLGVTNLGDGEVRLVNVLDLATGSAPRLVAWSSGARPCGSPPTQPPTGLTDGGRTVLALSYRLAPECPQQVQLQVRLLIRSGGAVRYVDSPQLADLRDVGFAQCAG